jgi:hypothetical protein
MQGTYKRTFGELIVLRNIKHRKEFYVRIDIEQASAELLNSHIKQSNRIHTGNALGGEEIRDEPLRHVSQVYQIEIQLLFPFAVIVFFARSVALFHVTSPEIQGIAG